MAGILLQGRDHEARRDLRVSNPPKEDIPLQELSGQKHSVDHRSLRAIHGDCAHFVDVLKHGLSITQHSVPRCNLLDLCPSEHSVKGKQRFDKSDGLVVPLPHNMRKHNVGPGVLLLVGGKSRVDGRLALAMVPLKGLEHGTLCPECGYCPTFSYALYCLSRTLVLVVISYSEDSHALGLLPASGTFSFS